MTAYRKRFYRATASVLVAAIGVTGLSATAASATASTSSAPVVRTLTTSSPTSVPDLTVGGAASIGGGTASPGATGGQVAPQSIFGPVIRAVIAAIKSVPKLWNAAVNAAKAGYTAFKNWWQNSVPQWIKNLVTGVTIYDIYTAIRDAIGL